MKEMPGVQYIDRLTVVMLQQDIKGGLDTAIMVGIVFFGVFEVGKAQIIDQNLLRVGSRTGGIGENLNLELPECGFRFGRTALTKHNFLALYVDAIVIPVFANLEDSGGL